MPKVTTQVDVKVVMEMDLAEARLLHRIIGETTEIGHPGSNELFTALHNALKDVDLLVKGVE